MPRFVVRVVRSDWSHTYKGPMPLTRAERERDAWLEAGREAEIIPPDAPDYVAWCRWLRKGGGAQAVSMRGDRFYPDKTEV